MAEKVLMKGNEAIGEAAVHAGCQCFFGYPITPQTEVAAYLSRRMPKINRVFLQAESEVAAINMVYGAAGCGVRVMTSSSSPGISLKLEGISYIAGAELPCVIINIVRGGPGLGGIQPAQSDYFQATKGGGHGDYRLLVYAPNSVQEMVDLVQEGFDKADLYRTPVMVMGDGMLGQMMEPVEFKERPAAVLPSKKDWEASGKRGRETHHIVNSLFLKPEELEAHNIKLQAKYKEIENHEVRYELFRCEGDEELDIVMVAYGITSRICMNAIRMLEKDGIRAGLIRPITLWPYPYEAIEKLIDRTKHGFLSVELSCGQMVEDVLLGAKGKKPVNFYGRSGGMIPTPKEVADRVKLLVGGVK